MCRPGDLIYVYNHKYHGTKIGQHPFIVISNEEGTISGLELKYDLIALVLSSAKSKEHLQWKLSQYPGNFPITASDKIIEDTNILSENKDGYVKAEQFFYFKSDELDYCKIGYLEEGILDLLIEFIEEMRVPVEIVAENL